jgi:hypothetical protein
VLIFAAAAPASATSKGQKGPHAKGVPAYEVYMKTKYELPAGTTIEWFFFNNSGQCIQYQPTFFTQTAGDKNPPKRMFLTPNFDTTSICATAVAQGLWHVRITTPDHKVDTGSVELLFKPGSPNNDSHHAWARCDSFGSIACTGSSETIPTDVLKEVELDVTLGPLS